MNMQTQVAPTTEPGAQTPPKTELDVPPKGDTDPKGQDPKGQSTAPKTNTDPGDPDLGWTPEQRKYLADLRKENAGHRTKNKELDSKLSSVNERFSKIETGLKGLFGDGDDKRTPEQQIEQLTAQNDNLALSNALRDVAWENDVSKEDYEYFEFLVGKKLNTLKEGEELSDEQMAELATQSKTRKANSSTSVGGTGPDGGGGKPPPPPDNDPEGTPTVEDFMTMSLGEKSLLYGKFPKVYDRLAAAAKAKRDKRLI